MHDVLFFHSRPCLFQHREMNKSQKFAKINSISLSYCTLKVDWKRSIVKPYHSSARNRCSIASFSNAWTLACIKTRSYILCLYWDHHPKKGRRRVTWIFTSSHESADQNGQKETWVEKRKRKEDEEEKRRRKKERRGKRPAKMNVFAAPAYH